MPAFIIATTRIRDADRYAAYAKAIAGLSERYGGEPVVRGPVTAYLEGEDTGERVVVSRFPDEQAAHDYIGSPEYQAARALREGAVEVVMRLVVS